MAIPSEKMAEFLDFVSQGNAEAAHVLDATARVARLADNITDGESENPQDDMARLLSTVFVELAGNAFYLNNAHILAPSMLSAILGWVQGDEWAKSDNPKTRIFGFVYREAIEHVAYTVAYMCGGFDHARNVVRALHELSHANGETLSEWEAEHGHVLS
jgi:hypothetical protein